MVEGPWADRIEQLRASATTDFQRDVLADGVVTRAEYEEAVQRVVSCMADAGNQLDLHEQGGYYTFGVLAGPGVDEQFDRCMGETGGLVGLYVDMFTNPDNLEFQDILTQCLKREGLLPDSVTADEFWDTFLGDGPGDLPFDRENSAFTACMANPALGAG